MVVCTSSSSSSSSSSPSVLKFFLSFFLSSPLFVPFFLTKKIEKILPVLMLDRTSKGCVLFIYLVQITIFVCPVRLIALQIEKPNSIHRRRKKAVVVLQTPFVPFPSLSRARLQAEKEEPDAKSAQTLLSSRPTRVNVNCAVAVSVPVRNPGECVCVCVCVPRSRRRRRYTSRSPDISFVI